jgi:hypothetical protein
VGQEAREGDREASDVVEFLATRGLSKDEVLARIGRDPTLSEPVRQFALDLARQAGAETVGAPEQAQVGTRNPAW